MNDLQELLIENLERPMELQIVELRKSPRTQQCPLPIRGEA